MDDIKAVVRENYGQIARERGAGCDGGPVPRIDAETIGYNAEQLAAAPEGANMGLGCGNPTAIAGLGTGETVLDLGSGGGFDCFLAANAVGPTGRVIGVDMTPEMIEAATRNALNGGYSNVEFRLGEVEALPVEDSSVDVIISNCVINLVPDKSKAFSEAFRVLKPGGRLHVSDIVFTGEVPDELRQSAAAYVSCVAGALHKEDYLAAMTEAGLVDITIDGERDAADLLDGCGCSPDAPAGGGCCGDGDAFEVPRGLVASITVSARRSA